MTGRLFRDRQSADSLLIGNLRVNDYKRLPTAPWHARN